ncbi:MAG: hypothetical protein K2X47_14275 [Bdellovibrionales bacterium]|nr:hypothetical protein [Bdellovibrionales bacterium]
MRLILFAFVAATVLTSASQASQLDFSFAKAFYIPADGVLLRNGEIVQASDLLRSDNYCKVQIEYAVETSFDLKSHKWNINLVDFAKINSKAYFQNYAVSSTLSLSGAQIQRHRDDGFPNVIVGASTNKSGIRIDCWQRTLGSIPENYREIVQTAFGSYLEKN